MNNNDYVRQSLELHLFFARIMKEHSLFLAVAFTEKDARLKKIADNFQNEFYNLLQRTIDLSDGNISHEVLLSEEIVTNNTLEAENKTSELSGTKININPTLRELSLRSGIVNVNAQLLNEISHINRNALPLIKQLIEFKNDILTNVLNCKMFTMNYPLLITHIMNEAKMYYDLLLKIENREIISNEYIYEQELFLNNIMK